MVCRSQCASRFPSTTLFRSVLMPPAPERRAVPFAERAGPILRSSTTMGARLGFTATPAHGNGRGAVHGGMLATLLDRSEEHTSELQSRENLVCRLLLEKKKR